MKIVYRLLISLCLLLITSGAKAHQVELSSTLLVEQGKNNWVLQVRAALTAFEYQVEQHYGESSYSSPEEFEELLLEYVRMQISVQFNGAQKVSLEEGTVKLGHETMLAFKLSGTPESIHSLRMSNTSFKDIQRSQSALMVLREGYSRKLFILNQDNGHAIDLKVEDNSFSLMDKSHEQSQNYFLFFLIAFSGVLIVFFISRQKLNLKLRPSLIGA